MKSRILFAALILVGLHNVVQAELVKCKKPDGRHIVQDIPCARPPVDGQLTRPVVGEKDPSFSHKGRPSANWERTTASPAQERPVVVAGQTSVDQPFTSLPTSFFSSSQKKPVAKESAVPGYLERKAEEERLAHNEQLKEQKKKHDCEFALKQVATAKMLRPVHTVDSKGERHYIEDEDRSKVIAQAEREAALFCS